MKDPCGLAVGVVRCWSLPSSGDATIEVTPFWSGTVELLRGGALLSGGPAGIRRHACRPFEELKVGTRGERLNASGEKGGRSSTCPGCQLCALGTCTNGRGVLRRQWPLLLLCGGLQQQWSLLTLLRGHQRRVANLSTSLPRSCDGALQVGSAPGDDRRRPCSKA